MKVLFVCLFSVLLLMCFQGLPGASETAMRGPGAVKAGPSTAGRLETSCPVIVFHTAIRIYQKRVSPIGGVDRCGFRPSCSAFSNEAITEQGPAVGLLMTADRLTRCNIFKKPDRDYTGLPNGKLWDPPSKNLLFSK